MKLRAKHCGKAPEQSSWLGAACRDFARPQAHVLDDVQVVAYDRPRVAHRTRKCFPAPKCGLQPKIYGARNFYLDIYPSRTATIDARSG